MRARRTTRAPTAAKLLVGASVLAFPATALAVTTTGNDTQEAAALHASQPAAVRYGDETVVRGSAPISAAGMPLELRYRPAGAASWRSIARGDVEPDGRFALAARVARSGGLQVVAASSASGAAQIAAAASAVVSNQLSAAAMSTGETTATTAPTASPAQPIRIAASPVRHVTIEPTLALAGGQSDTTAIAGQAAQIRGHLLPGIPGRQVVLEVQHGRRWVRAGTALTHRGGAFDLHYVPAATSSQRFQVAFAGDRVNGHADSAPRSVTPMQYAEVSWYYDGGETACGFHATYGIASRTLPCGSKVTFSYGGRSVVATVDDRGPFNYSRLYDLNQNTAGVLGMDGVATMLASV